MPRFRGFRKIRVRRTGLHLEALEDRRTPATGLLPNLLAPLPALPTQPVAQVLPPTLPAIVAPTSADSGAGQTAVGPNETTATTTGFGLAQPLEQVLLEPVATIADASVPLSGNQVDAPTPSPASSATLPASITQLVAPLANLTEAITPVTALVDSAVSGGLTLGLGRSNLAQVTLDTQAQLGSAGGIDARATVQAGVGEASVVAVNTGTDLHTGGTENLVATLDAGAQLSPLAPATINLGATVQLGPTPQGPVQGGNDTQVVVNPAPGTDLNVQVQVKIGGSDAGTTNPPVDISPGAGATVTLDVNVSSAPGTEATVTAGTTIGGGSGTSTVVVRSGAGNEGAGSVLGVSVSDATLHADVVGNGTSNISVGPLEATGTGGLDLAAQSRQSGGDQSRQGKANVLEPTKVESGGSEEQTFTANANLIVALTQLANIQALPPELGAHASLHPEPEVAAPAAAPATDGHAVPATYVVSGTEAAYVAEPDDSDLATAFQPATGTPADPLFIAFGAAQAQPSDFMGGWWLDGAMARLLLAAVATAGVLEVKRRHHKSRAAAAAGKSRSSEIWAGGRVDLTPLASEQT